VAMPIEWSEHVRAAPINVRVFVRNGIACLTPGVGERMEKGLRGM
jgi:hypothetical protein